jgi:Sec-independent protein translocase protein TatA
MRIQDLLIETDLTDEQLDEAGFAQGLGKVANTVGKGVGAVKGAYQGAKDAFSAGKNQTAQAVRSAVNGQQPATTAPAQAAPTTSANTPVQNTQAANPNAVPGPEAGQVEPTLDTPAAVRNAAAPTSNEVDPQSNVTTTNAPSTNKAKIGEPQGRQAVDNAMQTVNSVRSDRRANVIDYAKQSLDAAEQQLASIRKNAGIPPAQTQQAPVDNTVNFQQAAGQV